MQVRATYSFREQSITGTVRPAIAQVDLATRRFRASFDLILFTVELDKVHIPAHQLRVAANVTSHFVDQDSFIE